MRNICIDKINNISIRFWSEMKINDLKNGAVLTFSSTFPDSGQHVGWASKRGNKEQDGW